MIARTQLSEFSLNSEIGDSQKSRFSSTGSTFEEFHFYNPGKMPYEWSSRRSNVSPEISTCRSWIRPSHVYWTYKYSKWMASYCTSIMWKPAENPTILRFEKKSTMKEITMRESEVEIGQLKIIADTLNRKCRHSWRPHFRAKILKHIAKLILWNRE